MLYKTLGVTSNNVVFIGDSEFFFFDAAELFKNADILNRGILGDNTIGVYHRIDDVLLGHPKKIFIEIGTNDMRYQPNDTCLAYMHKILKRANSISPETKIYINSLLPRSADYKGLIEDYNKKLFNLCGSSHITYIDLYSKFVRAGMLNPQFNGGDTLHLNARGNILLAQIIKPYLASN
ncbi:GDSL-type esterase/lipase family protein [Mucilaginibacter jinjuensis]|uniref:GDSL-type esterase/lipase family protein n=1 Tax=Mucilaginibacter jinjuensis TaxID=1176721 RepID=A0ABY7T1N8_9SPHI|nr:GDSL-type esterase/lipase family protein [Mucilaginibacter jinjuensis]WCT10090.1 GDSL-type esterase/lipase family protein [Mucilaginibacter jinjuensis]